jgi:perosamine synthetase
MNIPLARPDIGAREIEYVTRAVRSGQLSLGPYLAEFEEKFAAYVGSRHAIATNSGTSALHLCVRAAGIGENDDVLTSSFSFVASANCIVQERAVPSFVDIDPATLNVDPREIHKAITRDYVWDRSARRLVNRRSWRVLKAILPVHVFGLPCDMAPILEIAREYNLSVIEDACEALGADYRGQRVGTFGDAGVFAFYPNKQMTTGEGGMIVTNDSKMAALCHSLRNQGRDEDASWLRHVRLGYNYRLSELHCALGLAQLERLEELLAARERVAEAYSRGLAGVRDVALPQSAAGTKRSWFVFVVQVLGRHPKLKRDALMASLRERGIACQAYFPAIHLQPYWEELDAAAHRPLPHTESAADRCLALPFFASMTQEEVDEVCAAVHSILDELRSGPGATEVSHAAAARMA